MWLNLKLQETAVEEGLIAKRLKTRLEHLEKLNSFETVESDGYDQWSKMRVFRILVDYLLRNGYHKSAKIVAAGIPGLNVSRLIVWE